MLFQVLVPLDGSSLAEKALEPALQIIEPKGRVTLVTAVDMPDVPLYGFEVIGASAPSYRYSPEEMTSWAFSYLNKIGEELEGRGYQVNKVVQLGDAASVIAETAELHQVDAIVMSTHGRSGINRWLFGSVTNKILAVAPCPVLVVPVRNKRKTSEVSAVTAHAES